jgi:hypothetical protein
MKSWEDWPLQWNHCLKSSKKNGGKKTQLDKSGLQALEDSLDTIHPDKGKIPIKILGYGEISLVFEFPDDQIQQLAYKRLPIFSAISQVERYIDTYFEYAEIFRQKVGISVPEQAAEWVYMDLKKKKGISLYCAQQKSAPESVANKVIHHLSDENIIKLVRLVLNELVKVWVFNQSQTQDGYQIGIDGQISNWSINEYDPQAPEINERTKLTYLDTSTPLYRLNGKEAMDPELFLKSTPSFLRWLIKWLFLQEVVDRYYNWRQVIIDLIANFYKEQLPAIIPQLISMINEFIHTELPSYDFQSITPQEVEKYYEGDKQIWVIFQNARRLDRFLTTKVFRKKYPFYLPGKIKR